MNQVLLTVSGLIDPEIEAKIARGERPVADYIAMAHAFGADLLDYAKARHEMGGWGKLLERVGGPNLLLAWVCFACRRRYQVIFTDGEQVGILLALLMKYLGFGRSRPRHLMIAHILSVPKKLPFFDWLKLQSHIDIFFVYATWQKQFIETRWKLPPERVIFTPFMVDARFFSPEQVQTTTSVPGVPAIDKPIICSVGLEFRDYPTLIESVRGLDVLVVIAAASPWSKRADSTANQEIPANVLVHRFTQFELRQLYAVSQFVTMPLYHVDFQAGVTAILEAMSMKKAVICSRTPGQTDVVVENETGLYVPPGDIQALRMAIETLLSRPDLAAKMGEAGRCRVEEAMSLEQYVIRLNRIVQKAITGNLFNL